MLTVVPLCWQLYPHVDTCNIMLTTVLLCWQLYPYAKLSSCWQIYVLTAMPSCWQLRTLILIVVLSHWQCMYLLVDKCVLVLTPVEIELCPNVDSCPLMLTSGSVCWVVLYVESCTIMLSCAHVDSCAIMLTAVPSYWIIPCLQPFPHVDSYAAIYWQLCLQVDSWCPHVDSCCIASCS